MVRAISWGIALLVAATCALALVHWTLAQAGWQPLQAIWAVRGWLGGSDAWTLPFLVASQAATVVVIPIPAGPLILANIIVAGPLAGLTLSLFGTVSGSVAAFLLGGRYGWTVVRRLAPTQVPAEPSRRHGSDGLWLLPVLWLPIPLGGDVACFVAGISGMRLRRFVVLAVLGRIPGTALGALLATGVTTGSAVWLGLGAAGLAALFVVVRYRSRARPGEPSNSAT